ncbi:hypothetical protein RE6C_03930 [Rhodopirellula europaea 6C]|uniref:Uncharacterized protein n=1 Tax=Rhodopirellula europaea 6C TaxID=1263867 RepID=M2AZD7_9BACT|nr:hypothetical protein RE6C_03930 [Rhodopirellula europaea 6C]
MTFTRQVAWAFERQRRAQFEPACEHGMDPARDLNRMLNEHGV